MTQNDKINNSDMIKDRIRFSILNNQYFCFFIKFFRFKYVKSISIIKIIKICRKKVSTLLITNIKSKN
jgi:hypothetical protein